jgi:pimeloyl-ACP methyl ester carboxylesterase
MRTSLLSFCLLLLALLHGCGSGGPEFAEAGRIEWLADPDQGSQSARFKVPLSAASGGIAQVSLALRRYPATGSKQGSLFLNPGGPGISAIDYLDYFAETGFGRRLRKHFDLLAFDPRGVGHSTPVRCVDDPLPYVAIDRDPISEIDHQRMVATMQAYAARCLELSGELLAHVGTMDVVHDLELIRQALGEGPLNYIGFSYGTKIGALYADTYPEHVRAMVLDGITPPSLTPVELALEQAGGFETSLQAFLDNCAGNDGCRFGGTDPGRGLAALMERLDREALPAGGGRLLGAGEAKYGIAWGLYADDYWPLLEEALAAAESSDGSQLLALTDAYFQRDSDGIYPNAVDAYYAVSCADAAPPSAAEVSAQADAAARAYPFFGAMLMNDLLYCVHWPARSAVASTNVRATGAPQIMLVGTTGDPATPYAWSQRLAAELESSFLVTLQAERHVAGGTNDCVDERYEQYLLQPNDGFSDLVCRELD